MPLIQPIKATDTDDAVRSKQNSAIARVNELDNTAADIAAFSASANAAARRASISRDETRDAAESIGADLETITESREAVAADRLATEIAANAAEVSRQRAADNEVEAKGARDVAVGAKDETIILKAAADIAAGAALLSANAAADDRGLAEIAANEAKAAENSLIKWAGAWAAIAEYETGDVVRYAGSSYICLVAHTSGTFTTDMGAGYWELMAQQGAPGPGSGDMNSALYDPTGKAGDAFARGNHSGEQPISSVTGLQAALNGKAPSVHDHDGAYYTKAEINAMFETVYTKGQIDAALALLATKASPTFTGTATFANISATGAIAAKGNITGFAP